MNKVIKEAIKESWQEYRSVTPTFLIEAHASHEHGWKEGYEWILSELAINKEISEDTLKKYMENI